MRQQEERREESEFAEIRFLRPIRGPHALFRDLVQMGRFEGRGAKTADIGIPLIVREDNHYVRRPAGLAGNSGGTANAEGKQANCCEDQESAEGNE